MTNTVDLHRRYRIVVALDLSDYAEVVLEHAVDQAARHDAPDMHFLTVVDDPAADLDNIKERLAALAIPALDDLDCGEWRARLHVRFGRPHEEITSLAAELRANLIVVGRFGLHHPGTRVGSVASHVLDEAPCPTLVVGLDDNSPDAQKQCESCVLVRAESEGERWFCSEHSAPDRDRLHLTKSIGYGSLTGGSLLW